ncbi:helix-turn-helix domain-containing protein [Simiduia aestuariiviva]|uniref:AraC-like DNA-binding protein n=1 Tax=Simiduia aestuariiviva TaxID=1510459 RepID=A0A839UGL8_9GAMM|nr:AraC family transcriptional regulator [Simiduia aestuariiviva]MBB3167194.1 AraC-like DNA-binding protein [Simiduia aestuariiviva]
MSFSLLPVNLIQIVSLAWCLLGIAIVWPQRRLRAMGLLLGLQALLHLFNLSEELALWRGPLVTPALMLGFGPALYFFTRQVVGASTMPPRQWALHGAPVLLALPFTAWPQWVLVAASLSQLLYTLSALSLLRRYHQQSREQRSDADEQALYWLRNVLCFWIVMEVQDHVRLHLQGQLPLGILLPWYTLNSALYAFMTGYLVLKAVHQPSLFAGISLVQAPAGNPDHPPDTADAAPIFDAIDTHLRSHGCFRQPRLSLRDVAEQLGLQEKLVSWAINAGAGQSFCDYINGLRVQAVCEHLHAAREPVSSLLQLGLAQGFNSKTSFNTAFKKVTGCTPSQYQRRPATGVRNPDCERH